MATNAGDDISGIVEAVGSEVFEYKQGDRVAAFHRMETPHGGYAEYAIVPASTTFHLPAKISFEAAAGLPLAFMTAAIGLYQMLRVPPPTEPGEKDFALLVYGGATAVGAYALQLAKLSNVGSIITVAGRGIEFVESLGAATHVIDYRKGDVAQAILKALDGKKLHHVFDAVSSGNTHQIVSEILVANGGGKLNMLDPPTDKEWKWPAGIDVSRTYVANAYSEKHADITQEQANADSDFAFLYYHYLARLLDEGRFKPHPHEVLSGGLGGIVEGVRRLHDGKVSATKLVVRFVDSSFHTMVVVLTALQNCRYSWSLVFIVSSWERIK